MPFLLATPSMRLPLSAVHSVGVAPKSASRSCSANGTCHDHATTSVSALSATTAAERGPTVERAPVHGPAGTHGGVGVPVVTYTRFVCASYVGDDQMPPPMPATKGLHCTRFGTTIK